MEESRVDRELRTTSAHAGKLGGEGQMANPGYKEIFDIPHGMECRCRSKMGSVLALLLSRAKSGNPHIYLGFTCLTAVSVRHVLSPVTASVGVIQWVLFQICHLIYTWRNLAGGWPETPLPNRPPPGGPTRGGTGVRPVPSATPRRALTPCFQ